ncbi:tape measure protein [Serratia marcescens]|uniref:tape measure protein n=1 Tax=Serratia marcescens TaxID=615 RepID=UPI000DFE836B|nr:tape measure protein [Serratia marcescens]SUI52578.1 Phage-related minor tail protein [Serratia marcescens]
MAEQNGGGILYQVEMDVAGLLVGQRQVNARLDEMEGRFNSTGKAVGSTEKAFSSLSRVAVSLSAALSVQQVAQYANAWVDVNNKLVNAVRPTEQLADVTQRVFDISQETRSGLEATATLYGRLERATRSAGTSAEDLAKLTTTINKGLIVSGATTQEASSTMIQLSQALASGVLRGEEFNSISENGSRLAVALADSLGVTVGQLRAMAAEGKLTTDVVVKGLLSQGDVIAKEFGNTIQTMGQAFQIAGNNITKFVGESSTVRSGIAAFNDAVVSMSENLDTVSTAVTAAALVFGGRYAGSLALAVSSQLEQVRSTIQAVAATRSRAKEEMAAASVTQRKAIADREAALSALNVATAEYNVARGSAAEAIALDNVIRLRAIYVQTGAAAALANNALSASQARVAATGLTMANAMSVIKTVTSPLGGPIGILAMVAAGWYLYAQNQAEARKESIAFANTLPDVIAKLKEMNLAQAQGVRADTIESIKNQKQDISELEDKISSLTAEYNKYNDLAKQFGVTNDENNGYVIKAAEAANELAKANRDLDSKTRTLAESQDALSKINIQVNQGILDQMKAARDNAIALAEAEKNTTILSGAQSFLAEKLGISTTAMQKFNAESLKINWGGSEGEKLIKQAERRLALSKLEGKAKAEQQAAYDAEDAGVTDPGAINALKAVYAQTEANTQAKKDSKKATSEQESADKKAATQAESVAQKVENLRQKSELAASSTQEFSREQAILTAQQSLGKGATQAQVALAGEYAAKAWDAAAAAKGVTEAIKAMPEKAENKSYAESMQNLKAALDAGKIDLQEYNTATEKMALEHQNNLAKINAQAVVNPVASARAEVDPVQQLANENAQKLALMQQYQQQEQAILQQSYQQGKISYDQFILAKQATDDQYLALRTAQEKQYQEQQTAAQWQLLSQQSLGYDMLTSAVDAFSGNASNAITGLLTGTMSAQEAMRSLGNTILNSVINSIVQVGVEALKNYILGQTLGAASVASSVGMAATTASAWAPAAAMASLATLGANAAPAAAGITSTVGLAGGLALAGARKNGGPVSPGKMYRVGEGGVPEVLQSSNGRNYLLNGDNGGKVISNKELTAGGGAAPTIIIENYSSGAGVMDTQASKGADGADVVRIVLADLQQGGQISQGISQYHQAPRKATE